MEGCVLRPAYYEPTFHKFKGELVNGVQIHVDGSYYNPQTFRPYRLVNLFLKATQRIHPGFELWRPPPYEYETRLMPIDILSGHDELRGWVAAEQPRITEWDESLRADEEAWIKERQPYLLY